MFRQRQARIDGLPVRVSEIAEVAAEGDDAVGLGFPFPYTLLATLDRSIQALFARLKFAVSAFPFELSGRARGKDVHNRA